VLRPGPHGGAAGAGNLSLGNNRVRGIALGPVHRDRAARPGLADGRGGAAELHAGHSGPAACPLAASAL